MEAESNQAAAVVESSTPVDKGNEFQDPEEPTDPDWPTFKDVPKLPLQLNRGHMKHKGWTYDAHLVQIVRDPWAVWHVSTLNLKAMVLERFIPEIKSMSQ